MKISRTLNLSLKSALHFGKIEKANKQKIIENLPRQVAGLPDTQFYRQIAIDALDYNNGVIVKWGGLNNPRGLIYADLVPEYVAKSDFKGDYLELVRDLNNSPSTPVSYYSGIDNLQYEKKYSSLISKILYLCSKEGPDGKSIK